jgi:serine/threonine-protein kinase HipA
VTEQLQLRMNGAPFGVLERRSADPADLAFWYEPGWSAWKHAIPLSISMTAPYDMAGSGRALAVYEGPPVYSWFLNLFPEAEQLTAFSRALRESELDVFGMLAKAGGDVPGALSVERTGSGAGEAPRHEPLGQVALAAAIRRLPRHPLLAGEEGVQMSAAGQQPKMGVRVYPDGRIAKPLFGAASTHILKPESESLFCSVENELFCLRLAKAAGLHAVEASAGEADGLQYLCVRRYDREEASNGAVARLHQEDLCQAIGLPPYRKYEFNARLNLRGATLEDCFRVLRVGVPSPALRRLRLLDGVVFNVLIDNVDAHAKNYSLVFSSPPKIELAPLYDLMHAGLYGGVTPNMAMSIAGQKRGGHVHRRHWERFARSVGLAPAATVRRVRELASKALDRSPPVAEAVAAEVRNGDFVRQIAAGVAERCRRVLANLETEGDADATEERHEAGQ